MKHTINLKKQLIIEDTYNRILFKKETKSWHFNMLKYLYKVLANDYNLTKFKTEDFTEKEDNSLLKIAKIATSYVVSPDGSKSYHVYADWKTSKFPFSKKFITLYDSENNKYISECEQIIDKDNNVILYYAPFRFSKQITLKYVMLVSEIKHFIIIFDDVSSENIVLPANVDLKITYKIYI